MVGQGDGRRRKALGWAAVGAAALTLALAGVGCMGGGQQDAPPEKPPVRVVFALADLERDDDKIIKATVEREQEKAGAKVSWLDAKGDPAQQQKQLREQAGKKIDAVVVQPVDAHLAAAFVEPLNRQGIKVVALGSLPENTALDGFIAADYALAGRLQARFALETLPGKRPLRGAVLAGASQDGAAGQLTAELQRALRETSDLELLGVYEQADPAGVAAAMADLVNRGGVDVIWAGDSQSALAAADYLRLGGAEKEVLTVGAGAAEKAALALAEGRHDAEVDLQPEMAGSYALAAAVALAETGQWPCSMLVENGDYSIPARIVPTRLITSDNVYLLAERWPAVAKAQKSSGMGQSSGQSGGGEKQQDAGQGGAEQQGGQEQQQGSGSSAKSMLRITTEDGKTTEVQIDGQVEKIESMQKAGKQSQDQQSQDEQSSGQGGSGSGGGK